MGRTVFVTLIGASNPAFASKCEAGSVFNPITKVGRTCIIPITIGGVNVGSANAL